MKFEAGKEYKTRDGSQARVYAVDGLGSLVIHGAVKEGSAWDIMAWTEIGRHTGYGDFHGLDLMPNKREFWVNVYGDVRDNVIHQSKTDALGCASDGCLETIKVREVLEDE